MQPQNLENTTPVSRSSLNWAFTWLMLSLIFSAAFLYFGWWRHVDAVLDINQNTGSETFTHRMLGFGLGAATMFVIVFLPLWLGTRFVQKADGIIGKKVASDKSAE